jgi:two-component system sensor histidine kinase CiaH
LKTQRSERIRASKVAVVATTIGIGCYVLSVLIFNVSLIDHMTSQVDARLSQRLEFAVKNGGQHEGSITGSTIDESGDLDEDDAPIFVWRIDATGASTAITGGAPRLLSTSWVAGESSVKLGHSTFRLSAVRFKSGWLVAGESLADVERVKDSLVNAELIFGAVLLVLMFGAAFIVGIRALAPIALAQRRQKDFTADASHELRTPLSVIEAEVEIALSRDRNAESYRAALERIGGEGRRLQRIVEDLLWLARSDGEQRKLQPDDTVDVGIVAAACVERFKIVAETTGLSLSFTKLGQDPATIRAPTESIDRLVGVLIDNACKFAGQGGQVEVIVATQGSAVTLEVDDSGPGIAENERALIFDRFHRTSTTTGGTGLGLAIADSIIGATQANCVIDTASIGGAKFEISWRFVPTRAGSLHVVDSGDIAIRGDSH